MTRTGQFFSEFIASTILMFCIYALQDNGNLGAGNLTPLMLFFVIFGIGACFGWETGYAINLARDFGKLSSSPILHQIHLLLPLEQKLNVSRSKISIIHARVRPRSVERGQLLLLDPDGCAVLRMHVWGVALRHVHLHRWLRLPFAN
jgi:Major intrinsic protein